MNKLTMNNANKRYYSEEYIRGWENGVQAQYKVDVESMPKGEWIKATGMMPPEFHGHHCCSECGNFANMEPPFGNREDLSKFCPNCGVRMKPYKGDDEL